MTVLQIVKGLIGEEDVSWGDSDTTFTRQIHTGGTTTIHYIDSKSIPANTLGGYIDTYLHTQHTDTGTTSTTFIINSSAAEYVVLSSTGQTAAITFTFPTSGSQALVGADDLSSTAAGEGASTIGIEDSAGNFTATDVETALAELAVSVAGQTEFRGYKRGFKLGYSTTTAITIAAGMWDHRGTTNQNVYTASQLTFTLGSAGSNSGSTNLGASQLHYIYIDDSAVVTAGTALLTATEFLNSTTAPAWSNAKCGWYNGNDRCVGAIRTDGSSHIVEFFVRSNNFYAYTPAGALTAYSSAAAPVAWTDLDLSGSIPIFCTGVTLSIYSAASTRFYFRIKDASVMSSAISTYAADTYDAVTVYTNASQVVEWSASAGSVTVLYVFGYYIDEL